uniref:Putative secreted peptide n=1 Tax=Anopheles braziliensis TaxID=58242 RepID=A0A2M3ZPC0_9DIPT
MLLLLLLLMMLVVVLVSVLFRFLLLCSGIADTDDGSGTEASGRGVGSRCRPASTAMWWHFRCTSMWCSRYVTASSKDWCLR